jgi:proline racemase
MLEPRGHAGMYGVIPVKPATAGAVIGALFIHNEGYSTMCGHATIALGRWLVESGQVPAIEPETRFALELPCGLVTVACRLERGRVISTSFESVPAFLSHSTIEVQVEEFGTVHLDIAYGGAFYAILPSSILGLDFFRTPIADLVGAATAITNAIRPFVSITHPDGADLSFLYGTILTDDAPAPAPTYNLCVFAEGQIDRSPTGSGVTARMARDHARGLAPVGKERLFYGPTGIPFQATVVGAGDERFPAAIRVRVSGTSAFSGRSVFLIEPNDRLGHGFVLPKAFSFLH